VLDPLGLPLATAVVPGNVTDDPLDVPAIRAVRQALGPGGRTYGGDCTRAALATRGFVAAGDDFYLCPLSEDQLSRAERRALVQAVGNGTQALQPVWRPGPQGPPDEVVAGGFAVDVAWTAPGGTQQGRWTERRWLVRSRAYAQTQEAALERRLANAEAALRELPTRKRRKKPLCHAELVQAAKAIVARDGVEGLLCYTVPARMTTRPVRADRDRPARRETEVSFGIDVGRDEARIEEQKREMGWQVSGTKALTLPLPAVVWAYRGQYRIEDDGSRLKGRSLGLTPVDLQDEQRIQGLVSLLSLALRVLTLVE
jgi:transposase